MTTLTIAELEHASERELGTTAWRTIDQEQVNLFAEATGDRQWIHVEGQEKPALVGEVVYLAV
jgi:acyl dehydratase